MGHSIRRNFVSLVTLLGVISGPVYSAPSRPLVGPFLEAIAPERICELVLTSRNPFLVDRVNLLLNLPWSESWAAQLVPRVTVNQTLLHVPLWSAFDSDGIDAGAVVVLSTYSPRINRSLQKFIKRHPYQVTVNQAFEGMLRLLRTAKENEEGVEGWLDDEFTEVLLNLDRLGYVDSIEVWEGDSLVAGAFGIRAGSFVLGMSHFTLRPNAGKLAVLALLQTVRDVHGISWINVVQDNSPVNQMGARSIPIREYLDALLESAKYAVPSLTVDRLLRISDLEQEPFSITR